MSKVIWITGLSGAGKTTLASSLTKKIRENGGVVVMLDGDTLREVFSDDFSNEDDPYSRENRLKLAYKYSRLCKLISKQGATVVIATISLFKEIHEWNRAEIEGYVEIFLDVCLSTLAQRDVKGIYKSNENIAGVNIEVDLPINPDRSYVDMCYDDIEDTVNKIWLDFLKPLPK